MFINYMPFLLLLFLAIDYFLRTEKIKWMIVCFFLIFLHSFFFSIACIVAGGAYLFYQHALKKSFIRFCIAIALAIGLASILLIPAGLAILENAKDSGTNSLWDNFGLNFPLSSLLYSPYGCGLTLIALYSFFLGIREKSTRIFSSLLLSCFFFKIVAFILNGTLYARDKILIPFLPLVILLCAVNLEKLRKGEIKHNLWFVVIIFLFAVPWSIYEKNLFIFLDAVFLLIWILLTLKRQEWYRYVTLMLLPPILFLQTNSTEEFVSENDQSQTIFSEQELKDVYQNHHYRFDFLADGLSNVNYLPFENIKKSSMYSSTTNTLYSEFFYDIMRNPISINNRVALIPGANPFFMYLMGVRYIETTENVLPYGYYPLKQKESYVLAENQWVLPTAYGSTCLYSEKEFDKLSYPYNLDTISNYTVVPKDIENDYQSNMEVFTPNFIPFSLPESITYDEQNKLYEVHSKKEINLNFTLEKPISRKVLLISFDIKDISGKGSVISINGIKNKLSATTAPYPNKNYTFTYMLSSNEDIQNLSVELSKGNYNIENISFYTIDTKDIGNYGIIPFQFQKTSQNQVLNGSISMYDDGYFVTSLPYQKGFQVYVDGKKTETEIVNKAFVGFPLSEGKHEVKIYFYPPGKNISFVISGISFLFILLIFIKERKHRHDKTKIPNDTKKTT